MKSSMHNYATKIRNCEKRRVQMQDTGDALAVERPKTYDNLVYIKNHISKLQCNCKPKTYNLHTNKSNQLKYNAKGSHQSTKGENKRRREEKRATETNPKQFIKWHLS